MFYDDIFIRIFADEVRKKINFKVFNNRDINV
jgi:hypothetical protein